MLHSIAKFGFEIEGEFSSDFEDTLSPLGEMKGDGSVHNCPSSNAWHIKHGHSLDTGEFASEPFNFTPAGVKKATDLMEQFEEAWKNGEYHNNESAGFHVHVSFKPTKIPPEILSVQFNQYFIDKMKEEFPAEFKKRKDNRYCSAEVLSESQISRCAHDRYKAVNFTNLMGRRHTVEIRIFPSAEPKKMLSYCQFVLSTIKNFLSSEKLELSSVLEFSNSTKEILVLESKIGKEDFDEVSRIDIEDYVFKGKPEQITYKK